MSRNLTALLLLSCATFAAAQRLPQTAVPTHYGLHFTPDLKSATFAGDEVIDLNLSTATESIVLNAAEITFDTVIATQNGRKIDGSAKTDEAAQQATLSFAQRLAPGPLQLHIVYKGILNDKLRGLYLSKGQDRNYATTQFESTDARRAFPSFDEPAFKATFDISLTIDQGDTAISNGSIARDVPGPGAGKHTLTFTPTPKMSTYLVAMAVGDWKCSEGEQDGVPIRVCATPDKVNLTPYALKSAKEILHFYNTYYSIKWPWKKLDILAVPDFEAGAMENTAAIFYRETDLLIDDQHSSVEAHKRVFDVLAHEMAHQWFGDLVTMQWWNDIWLNEGFATWMTYKPDEALHPEWKGSLEEASETADTLVIDARKTTRAIRQQANTPDEINALFDGIAYQKAASVLRMVEHYVGPEAFRKGVNAYLQQHAYGNATAQDFWSTVTRVSGKPVDKIMSTYTEQAGAPLLSVKAACANSGSQLQLAQQRFFADKSQFGSAPEQLWTIPVCTHTSSDKSACQILDRKENQQSTHACMQGAYFNAGGRGFYRTLYDRGSLEALKLDTLSPEERVLLASDQWALVRAGQQPIGDYLNVLSKLSNDQDRLVILQLTRTVRTISEQIVNDSDRSQFAAWVDRIFTPQLQRIGMDPKPGESPDNAQLRPELYQALGEMGHDNGVIEHAQQMAQRYLQDPNAVDPSLAQAVLAIAAENGDAALYDQYLQAMSKAKTPEQFYNLGNALVSFRQPELVKRTILYATSDKVRNQDAPLVFAGELFNPDTRDIAWPILKSNWPAVSAKLTQSSGSAIVQGAGQFCSEEKKEDVKSFFAEHPVASSERALRQSLERIDVCINLKANNSGPLHDWLAAHAQ